MLTQDKLRELLEYCPYTGVFTWKVDSKSAAGLKPVAGYPSQGYIRIHTYGGNYWAHRLVWLYVFGYFPDSDIEHINGVRDDNRLKNLRLATRSRNMQNTSKHRDNSSGYKGVDWNKKKGKWRGRVSCLGRTYQCMADDINVCIAFVHDVRVSLHGEFANSGVDTDA